MRRAGRGLNNSRNKRLLCSLISVFLIIASMTTSVYALPADNLTLNGGIVAADGRTVNIAGLVNGVPQGTEIILLIAKPGKSVGLITDFDDWFAYASKAAVKADGSFEFKDFTLGSTGEYSISLSGKGIVYSGTTFTVTKTVWEDLAEKQSGSNADFGIFIDKNATHLNLDLSEYNTLDTEKQEAVLNKIKTSTEATLATEFDKAVMWTYIDQNKNDSSEILALLKNRKDNALIKREWFDDFLAEDFGEEAQNAAISNAISGMDMSTGNTDTFLVNLENRIVVDYIKNYGGYSKNIENLLVDVADSRPGKEGKNIFGFSLDKVRAFYSMDDNKDILDVLVNESASLNTSTAVIERFEALVAIENTSDSGTDDTPVTGDGYSYIGGGNSGGGGGKWQVEKTKEPENITSMPEEETQASVPETEKVKKFTDIEDVKWAEEAILSLAEWGILNGKEDGKFDPNSVMTREEIVKMLDNAFEWSKEAVKNEFNDVKETDWYYSAVSAAASKGIITGYPNGSFGIGDKITREDAAVIMLRTVDADVFSKAEIIDFADKDDISDYAREAVAALSAAKVINGMGDGKFMPKSGLTRAEAAKMFYALITHINLQSEEDTNK